MPSVEYASKNDVADLYEELVGLGLKTEGIATDRREGIAILAGLSKGTIDGFFRDEGEKLTLSSYTAVNNALKHFRLAMDIQQHLQGLHGSHPLAQLAQAVGIPESHLSGFRDKLKRMPSVEELRLLRHELSGPAAPSAAEPMETKPVPNTQMPANDPEDVTDQAPIVIEIVAQGPEEAITETVIVETVMPVKAEIDEASAVGLTDETADQSVENKSQIAQSVIDALEGQKVVDAEAQANDIPLSSETLKGWPSPIWGNAGNDGEELLTDGRRGNQFPEDSASVPSPQGWPPIRSQQIANRPDESQDFISATSVAKDAQGDEMSQAHISSAPGFAVTSQPPQEVLPVASETSEPTEGQKLANMLAHVAQLAEAGGPDSALTFEARVGTRTVKIDIGR
jgi:hypothetical protein